MILGGIITPISKLLHSSPSWFRYMSMLLGNYL